MMRKNFTIIVGAFLVAALGLGSLAYAEEVTEPGTEVVDPDDPAQYEDPTHVANSPLPTRSTRLSMYGMT